VLPYNPKLKGKARELRKKMTDSEKALWSRLRGKKLLGVQFVPKGSFWLSSS